MSERRFSRARSTEVVVFAFLWAATALVVLPIFAILAAMLVRGAGGLTLKFVFSVKEGLLPATIGTLYLVALTAAIAAPVGIAAAVYLSEYARPGPLVRLVRLSLVNLAGVPSVVYGLFGLAIFVMLLQFGRSLLAGSCTLALLVLPLMIGAAEESLRQVPQGLRQASLALGASRWQTTWRVVLPDALPGIITGLILSVGRAAGETAPILFTAAFFSLTHPFPRSVFDEVLALPYQLFVMATEVPNVPPQSKWAAAVVLVGLVLGLNLFAIIVRARLRRARKW